MLLVSAASASVTPEYKERYAAEIKSCVLKRASTDGVAVRPEQVQVEEGSNWFAWLFNGRIGAKFDKNSPTLKVYYRIPLFTGEQNQEARLDQLRRSCNVGIVQTAVAKLKKGPEKPSAQAALSSLPSRAPAESPSNARANQSRGKAREEDKNTQAPAPDRNTTGATTPAVDGASGGGSSGGGGGAGGGDGTHREAEKPAPKPPSTTPPATDGAITVDFGKAQDSYFDALEQFSHLMEEAKKDPDAEKLKEYSDKIPVMALNIYDKARLLQKACQQLFASGNALKFKELDGSEKTVEGPELEKYCREAEGFGVTASKQYMDLVTQLQTRFARIKPRVKAVERKSESLDRDAPVTLDGVDVAKGLTAARGAFEQADRAYRELVKRGEDETQIQKANDDRVEACNSLMKVWPPGVLIEGMDINAYCMLVVRSKPGDEPLNPPHNPATTLARVDTPIWNYLDVMQPQAVGVYRDRFVNAYNQVREKQEFETGTKEVAALTPEQQVELMKRVNADPEIARIFDNARSRLGDKVPADEDHSTVEAFRNSVAYKAITLSPNPMERRLVEIQRNYSRADEATALKEVERLAPEVQAEVLKVYNSRDPARPASSLAQVTSLATADFDKQQAQFVLNYNLANGTQFKNIAEIKAALVGSESDQQNALQGEGALKKLYDMNGVERPRPKYLAALASNPPHDPALVLRDVYFSADESVTDTSSKGKDTVRTSIINAAAVRDAKLGYYATLQRSVESPLRAAFKKERDQKYLDDPKVKPLDTFVIGGIQLEMPKEDKVNAIKHAEEEFEKARRELDLARARRPFQPLVPEYEFKLKTRELQRIQAQIDAVEALPSVGLEKSSALSALKRQYAAAHYEFTQARQSYFRHVSSDETGMKYFETTTTDGNGKRVPIKVNQYTDRPGKQNWVAPWDGLQAAEDLFWEP